jgi:hypothetical protein
MDNRVSQVTRNVSHVTHSVSHVTRSLSQVTRISSIPNIRLAFVLGKFHFLFFFYY